MNTSLVVGISLEVSASLAFRSVLAIGGLIGTVVLLFIGFGKTIKFMKKEERSTPVPKNTILKSTLIVVAALVLMMISLIASKYGDVIDGNCTFAELIRYYIVYVARTYGWIAAIPWLLNLMRRSSRPSYDDTDKM